MKKITIKSLQQQIKYKEIFLANKKEKVRYHYLSFKKNINLSTFLWSGAGGFVTGWCLVKLGENRSIHQPQKNTVDSQTSAKKGKLIKILLNSISVFQYLNLFVLPVPDKKKPHNNTLQ